MLVSEVQRYLHIPTVHIVQGTPITKTSTLYKYIPHFAFHHPVSPRSTFHNGCGTCGNETQLPFHIPLANIHILQSTPTFHITHQPHPRSTLPTYPTPLFHIPHTTPHIPQAVHIPGTVAATAGRDQLYANLLLRPTAAQTGADSRVAGEGDTPGMQSLPDHDQWPASPKINRRLLLFFALKTDCGIKKLTWKNYPDRKIIAAGDLILVKLTSGLEK